jgi:hypothetical protein
MPNSDRKELADGFPSRPDDLFAYQGLIVGSEAGYFTLSAVSSQPAAPFGASRQPSAVSSQRESLRPAWP